MIFGKKKVKEKRTGTWINFAEDSVLVPSGYVTLDKNPEILRCVDKIAQTASSMSLMLLKNTEKGDERIYDRLSYKIDVNPCSSMTRKNFYYLIFRELQLKGNVIVYPTINMDGLVEDLTILDNAKIIFQDTPNDYKILYNGTYLNKENVLNFVLNPRMDKQYRGLGIMPLIIDAIKNLNQENATRDGFLKSKWKPSLIMSIPSDIEELSDSTLRNKILKSYTETVEDGEPWLIPAGELNIETVKPLTLNDLAIKENLEIDKKTLATGLGIPPFLIGMGEFNANEYNNFISSTVMSIAQNVQQELTRKILLDPGRYFKFNPKSLMQYNLNEKVEFVTKLISLGLLSRNEGRNEFDYTSIDDPSMDEYMVLENYIPVDKTGEQKKLNGGDENE